LGSWHGIGSLLATLARDDISRRPAMALSSRTSEARRDLVGELARSWYGIGSLLATLARDDIIAVP